MPEYTPDLPVIYEPGTRVVIHDVGNLDGIVGTIRGVQNTMRDAKGSVWQFLYNVELANLAVVQIPDSHLTAVAVVAVVDPVMPAYTKSVTDCSHTHLAFDKGIVNTIITCVECGKSTEISHASLEKMEDIDLYDKLKRIFSIRGAQEVVGPIREAPMYWPEE